MSIFGRLPLAVMKNPAGTYSYVGTVPYALGKEVPAKPADVMGGRAYETEDGKLVTRTFPVFATAQEAVEFAASKGCKVEQVCE